jgi:hypothetical protein
MKRGCGNCSRDRATASVLLPAAANQVGELAIGRRLSMRARSSSLSVSVSARPIVSRARARGPQAVALPEQDPGKGGGGAQVVTFVSPKAARWRARVSWASAAAVSNSSSSAKYSARSDAVCRVRGMRVAQERPGVTCETGRRSLWVDFRRVDNVSDRPSVGIPDSRPRHPCPIRRPNHVARSKLPPPSATRVADDPLTCCHRHELATRGN